MASKPVSAAVFALLVHVFSSSIRAVCHLEHPRIKIYTLYTFYTAIKEGFATASFILILSSTTIPFPLHYWNVVFHREEAIFKQLKQGRLVTYQFTFQDSSWVRIHFHPQFDLLFRMYHGGIYLLTSDGRQRKYICDYSPCGFALGFEDEDIGIFNRMSVQECSLSELDEIIISYAGSSCFVAEQGDASEDIKTSGDSKVQE